MWLSLELAGDFGKEFEVETGSCLPVTNASFAVARLAALNPIGSIQTVCKDTHKKETLLIVEQRQQGNKISEPEGPQFLTDKCHRLIHSQHEDH